MDLSVVNPPEPFPYDEWMMRYAYAPFEPGEAEEGLREIVEEGLRRGLKSADNDARSSNPRATGRIHSDDPLTVLEEDMAVRRVLIGRFGADVLQPSEPDLLLFERLIPAYFHHRHSLKAVATMLGGVDFTYHPTGDFLRVETVIDSRDQLRALDAILAALSPDELAIPPRVAEIVPARLESSPVSELEWPVREPGVFLFITHTAPLRLPLPAAGPFDPLGWARVLADLAVSDLLDPERLTRVAAHHASGRSGLPVEQVLNRIIQGTWGAFWPEDPTLAPLRRIAREAVLDRLLDGARAEEPHMELREPFLAILEGLLDDLRRHETADPAERAHLDEAISRIGEIV